EAVITQPALSQCRVGEGGTGVAAGASARVPESVGGVGAAAGVVAAVGAEAAEVVVGMACLLMPTVVRAGRCPALPPFRNPECPRDQEQCGRIVSRMDLR